MPLTRGCAAARRWVAPQHTTQGGGGTVGHGIFDLDGTHVDSNYQHAIAWYRAFRAHDRTPALWRIHRAIGIGGDRLVAAVCGDEVEAGHGDDLRAAWAAEFDQLIDEVAVLAGARDLLRAVSERGLRVVLASSGRPEHVRHYQGDHDRRDQHRVALSV